TETCLNGVCTAGTGPNCNDGNPCTVDSCDPVNGCQHANAPNGTSCADGTVCNGSETCQSGVCTAGTALNCNDNNPCTIASCDPVNGAQPAAGPTGTSSPDGTVCNGMETCQSGACTAGTALNCNDNNPCTTDSCDPVLGCRNTPVTNGTSCA